MWQLDSQQRTASLTSDQLAARISIAQPELGLGNIAWRAQQLSAQLLGVVLCDLRERAPLDCYVRALFAKGVEGGSLPGDAATVVAIRLENGSFRDIVAGP